MTSKKKLLALGAVLLLLVGSFWYGGSAPGLQGWQISPPEGEASSTAASAQPTLGEASSSPTAPKPTPTQPAAADSSTSSQVRPPAETPPESSQVSSSPEPTAPSPSLEVPIEGQEVVPPSSSEEETDPEPESCTLSIRCDAALEHLDLLDQAVAQLLPADGIILAPTQASFEEGDTAFSLLQRLTRQEGIHLEASFTPGYGSSYVEGIANLYEFDCGAQSGWLYLINGISPGCGSSQYALSPGDTLEWIYTCDMGADAGVSP